MFNDNEILAIGKLTGGKILNCHEWAVSENVRKSLKRKGIIDYVLKDSKGAKGWKLSILGLSCADDLARFDLI